MTMPQDQTPIPQPPPFTPQTQTRLSFGMQAARFSIFAPFTVFLISVFTKSVQEQSRGALMAILSINILLIVMGFIFGIVALVSTRRFGREGIFGRAISGIVLNGLVLMVVLFILAPMANSARIKTHLVGHWSLIQTQQETEKNGQLELIIDKNGDIDLIQTIGSLPPETIHGQWGLTKSNVIGIKIEDKKFGLGSVKTLDEIELILGTDSGEEMYKRVK